MFNSTDRLNEHGVEHSQVCGTKQIRQYLREKQIEVLSSERMKPNRNTTTTGGLKDLPLENTIQCQKKYAIKTNKRDLWQLQLIMTIQQSQSDLDKIIATYNNLYYNTV